MDETDGRDRFISGILSREQHQTAFRQWDALADEVQASPFLRSGWFTAWANAYGTSLDLLVSRSETHLSGIVPIIRTARGVRSPTNSETPYFSFLASDRSSQKELIESMMSIGSRIDLSYVDPKDDAIHVLLSIAGDRGYTVMQQPIQQSAFISTSGSWDEYLAGLDKKHRHEIRRLGRRMHAAGQVDLQIYDGTSNLDELLAQGMQLERSGWKSEYGTSIVDQPDALRFYTSVAHWAASMGWLRLAFLKLDGQSIAFDFCLEANRAMYPLKIGYDTNFSQLSPGFVMRSMMIQRCFEGENETYEFGGGTEGERNRWKLKWTSKVRQRIRIRTFAPNLLGRAEKAVIATGSSVKNAALAAAKRTLSVPARRRIHRVLGPVRRRHTR